jgi:N-acetylmuramate 1-kinase
MLQTSSGGSSFTVALPSEQATARLAVDLAAALEPGDLVTLSGDLGAGKTTFARALIRILADDPAIEVPSPTFTLMQTYELPGFPLVHADLYRIAGSSELAELGFDDLAEGAVVLMEWPDRAAGYLPPNRLDITFTLAPQFGLAYRHARIIGYGTFALRAERMIAARKFLDESGFGDADRQRLAGDASTRCYERLTLGQRQVILMNSPRRPDGPPVRGGRPYSAIAHLAEDVKPFVAMANALRSYGFSAPEIHAADLTEGFIVLEDLGAELVVDGDPPLPIEYRYEAAVDMLVALHRQELPDVLPVAPHVDYRLPGYDIDALLIEVELLLDWYLPRLKTSVRGSARQEFLALWRETLQPVLEAPPTWVLRDFHSPNLLWLGDRAEHRRIGLLDFQDAMIGPAAYDLASLLQDARVDVPEAMEMALLGRYARARRASDRYFDVAGFATTYAALAAQRASKILGIFARLDRRDGKPQYLRHIPRVWNYLQRALSHQTMASLGAWYAAHVPPPA